MQQILGMKEAESIANLLQNQNAFEQWNSRAHNVQTVMKRSVKDGLVNELNTLQVLRGANTHQEHQSYENILGENVLLSIQVSKVN